MNNMSVTKYIPNTITCLNLLSGCLAVIFALSIVNPAASGMSAMQWAWIFIGAAAVFDFCDGAAARLLKAYSTIGKELDSLCDVVSFGVAPGMLVFKVMETSGCGIWSYAALFLPVMGALRLAKFNVDDRQTTSFLGLPIPSNAIFWIGITAWIQAHGILPTWLMVALIIAIGLLMVSNLPMFSLKFKDFSLVSNVRRYGVLLGAILFVVFEGIAGFAWAIVLYILLSMLKPIGGKKELG